MSFGKPLIPFIHKLGVRLNIILLGSILFFLVSSGFSLWVLQQQSQQFKAVTQTYYDRAMLAAELSRDAELIATQAMEQSVTQRLGSIDATVLQADMTRIFTVAREKLTADTADEAKILKEIDRLTTPYFSQLITFYRLIEQQQHLAQNMNALNRERQRIIMPLLNFDMPTQSNVFNTLMVNYSHSSLAYTEASSPGLMARRKQQLLNLQQTLLGLENLTTHQQQSRSKLIENITKAVSLKEQLHNTNLASLSAMRQTRLFAQRLSSVCYDFYLMVKLRAEQASARHSQLIEQVNIQIALFSVAFLGLIGFAYWFIQHFILKRLNRLSSVMQQHAIGEPTTIPVDGNDEITVIGKTFAQFVKANQAAHKEVQAARQATEAANNELRTLNSHLQKQNNTDELTQIANRRSFFNWLESTYIELAKEEQGLSILMIDIDWFKSFNDHYGHQEGDKCLRHVSQILEHVSKNYEGMLARYGGEEFIIAVPQLNQLSAEKLGAELLAAIEHANIPHGYVPMHHVTISIGAASLAQVSFEYPVERLIAKADQALYEAKTKGRSQLVSYLV